MLGGGPATAGVVVAGVLATAGLVVAGAGTLTAAGLVPPVAGLVLGWVETILTVAGPLLAAVGIDPTADAGVLAGAEPALAAPGALVAGLDRLPAGAGPAFRGGFEDVELAPLPPPAMNAPPARPTANAPPVSATTSHVVSFLIAHPSMDVRPPALQTVRALEPYGPIC